MNLSQCRLRIVNYFDDLVNDVDLKAEKALAEENLGEIEIEQVNERREAIISRVRQVQDHNLANLDKTYKEEEFEKLPETEIDARLFHKFCFTIDKLITIDYASFADEIFGHFVVVDRFVREETLAAFRELFECIGWNVKKLSFEPAVEVKSIRSDMFTEDNLMIECTIEELFKLSSVEIRHVTIKSIKEPARVLYENIQRVDYIINDFSEEYIESVELLGRHAEFVHLTCYIKEFRSSVISLLSDIKIKSLTLQSECRIHFNGKFPLADFLLPFFHLEELEISKYNEELTIEHERIKLDRLRKLTLKNCEVDVQFIECFENLNELVLESMPNTAESFIKKKLKKMKHLQRLEITDSRMREIEPESFEGLHSLTSLCLKSNEIKKIHENAFVHLNNLTHLSSSCNNELKTLDSSALNGLTSLTSLDLSCCHFTSLDENLFNNLRSLTDLNLSGNRMQTICRSICGLSRIKKLDLSCNSIETLDAGILENLVELETLVLSKNKITSLEPNVFQRLVKLQNLSLHKNKLWSIEAGAFHGLSALKLLNLSNNKISSIEPAAFSPMAASLEHLNLNCNKIQKLVFKERLEKPSSLRCLNLSFNQVTHIESNFFSLFPQLETLTLRYNRINQFEKETFWSLESLALLDLSYNKIEYLHPELFKSQGCLKKLCIVSNALKKIDRHTFSANLVSLEQLYVTKNRISSLQDDSFAHLRQLKVYDKTDDKCNYQLIKR